MGHSSGKITGYAWLATGGTPIHLCGVVMYYDQIEGEKAYIGLRQSSEEKADILWIKEHGNKISTKVARDLIYRYGKWI